MLVLKLGHPRPLYAGSRRARRGGGGRANIRFETRTLPTADSHALTACADIVLSLHRSEGFGLVPAEAMLLGRPVVATGWSGNMEFMDETPPRWSDYRLVPVADPRGNLRGARRRAGPSRIIAHAARHLVRLADERRRAGVPRCPRTRGGEGAARHGAAGRGPRGAAGGGDAGVRRANR